MLDGPVIQTADDIALRGGVRIDDVIRTVREAHRATGKPVLVMSYWNPIVRYGIERFTTELAEAGGAGCILPDLPVQESAPWRLARRTPRPRHHLRGRAEQRRRATAGDHRGRLGFVYASSLMGVTGTRESVSEAAGSLVRRVRATTELPVCVGIGISNAAQAAHVAGFADGVIVESVLVKAILDAPDEAAGLAAIARLTAELADGVRRAPAHCRPGAPSSGAVTIRSSN